MIDLLIGLLIFSAALWLATRLFLRGPDLSQFDTPVGDLACGRIEASPENERVLAGIDETFARLKEMPRLRHLAEGRRLMDAGFLGAPIDPDELGVRLEKVDANGVAAEWVLAPGADPLRRFLYIHGGGFALGSPASARMLTAKFSELCGVAVLSVDYRLMPEYKRLDSVEDCQAAYRWMLDNGPDGPGPARQVFVSGDSAGGNLALMLAAWSRDTDVRSMDAVVALSPSTDSTLSNPSARDNIATDPLLGPHLGLLARLPATVKSLIGLIGGRTSPRNPLVSPLIGDLSGLPPTLVQASDCEMLLDDSRRYVNKAVSQGSPATLQLWPGMVHVFQMYWHMLPEAGEALNEAARFIDELASTGQAAR